MKQYAKVIVRNNSIHTDNLFTYEIPDFFSENICIGHRILVPFGMYNKPLEAFVFDIVDFIDENIKTKKILDLLDEEPIFNKDDINLIIWMKNKYLCTYIDCINLLYPKGYKLNNFKVIKLKDEDYKSTNKNENKILEILKNNKGKIKFEKIKKIPNANNLIYKMQKNNIVELKWEYKDHKNEKKVYSISLIEDIVDIDDYININKIRLGNKQKEIIEFLKEKKEVDLNEVLENLKITRQSINKLKEKNLIRIEEVDFYRSPEQIYSIEHKEINLNEEQSKVVSTINSEMFDENKKPYMIHGVTGPNEYDNNVNNNWYTNYLAKWCLEYAAENISKLEKECIESVNRNNVKVHLHRLMSLPVMP